MLFLQYFSLFLYKSLSREELGFSSIFFLLFIVYGAPGADWRTWIFLLFPHQQIFRYRKMRKRNIEFTETISERNAIYVLSSRCCCWTKKQLKVSSGGLGKTVSQVLTIPEFYPASPDLVPRDWETPHFYSHGLATLGDCAETQTAEWIWPQAKKHAHTHPQSQPPSIFWLSGLLSARVFNNVFINSGKFHFVYSICLHIVECGVIHRVLHKIAHLLMLLRCM